jgi:hypothetical protein
VSVLLGNGDGTFRPPRTFGTLPVCYGITAADFNGDGKLDLALSCLTGGLSVLLGNGDGTFQPQSTVPSPNFFPFVIATGDFNSDGVPDLAVATPQGEIAVYLNDGSGTFTFQDTFPAGTQGNAITVGDFNRDGMLDVAVADNAGQAVVLLGNGNGAFSPAQAFPVGGVPAGIAAGDLNHDAISDLVLSNSLDGTVSVLIGNGDGTFQPQRTFDAGSRPNGIVIADLNGDGIPDLAVADELLGAVIVLLGNGDGTFQPQQAPYHLASNSAPVGLVSADFNGDGVPDLATGNSGLDNTSILLGGRLSTGQLNNVPVPGVGDQNIQATFTPDGNFYGAGLSNIVPAVGNGPIQTSTVVTSSQNPSTLGQPVTFTATVTAVIGGSPTGTVTFFDGTIVLCSLVPVTPITNGSTATCQSATLTLGRHSIVAMYNGDNNFLRSQSQPLDQLVNQVPGDFTILPITPASITVSQGFSNATTPFFSQTVQVTVHPLNGYNGTVTLSCGTTPPLPGGSCVINPPDSGMIHSLASGDFSTTLTITAGVGTQLGPYMITVTGQDMTGLQHSASQDLTIINTASGVTIPPGGGGSTIITFTGPPGTMINPACTGVVGTGLSGQQSLGTIGGTCVFTPSNGTIPGPIQVTISGCTVAGLRTHMPIYATFLFGLPGLVMLGSLRFGRRTRRKMLRIGGFSLLIGLVLLIIACGGVGGSSGSNLTPTGHYQVLVQGTGPDGTVYSAIVPVNVVPLTN